MPSLNESSQFGYIDSKLPLQEGYTAFKPIDNLSKGAKGFLLQLMAQKLVDFRNVGNRLVFNLKGTYGIDDPDVAELFGVGIKPSGLEEVLQLALPLVIAHLSGRKGIVVKRIDAISVIDAETIVMKYKKGESEWIEMEYQSNDGGFPLLVSSLRK